MGGKFSAIGKVKKQLLDKKEAALLESRAVIARIKNEIYEVQEALEVQQFPQKGTYADMLHVRAITQRLVEQKNHLRHALEEATQKMEAHLAQYYEARREFEKIKYLEEQEYSAMLKALKKQEQLTLDEVALQLYAMGGKER